MVLAAGLVVLAACPEGGKTSASGTGETSGTTGATATATGGTTAPTTGGAIVKCADAVTEAECAAATEMQPEAGLGCRWGELQVATIPQGGGMCTLETIGGVCVLADFNEGGPGCWGFYREGAGGVIELVEFGCGTPAGDAWTGCWELPMSDPGFAACACLNPNG